MGLMDRMVEWLVAEPRKQQTILEQRAAAGNSVIPWYAGKPQYLPRNVETYDHDAYRKVALIFRAVQYIADAAATAPLRAYIEQDGELAELEDHPIRQLFTRPNPGMGEANFLSFVTMVMAVSGFVVIEKERDRVGNVIGLWPLRSDWIRPIPRQQDQPDWEYRIPGEQYPRILDADDVIPITYADTPDRSYTGIGPLEILIRETSVVNSLTDFLKVFMDRGALPLYAIIPQDEGPAAAQWKKQETKDAFMAAWRNRYGGMRNAAEPLPMVGVKDVKRIGLDFNELAYRDLNDLQDAHIATAFGIPPILLGAQVGLDKATYSNYEQARRSFYEDTMTPLWARLDDAFSRHLLNDRDFVSDIELRFDTSSVPALRDDETAAVERAVKLFTAGIISRHPSQRIAGVDVHGPDVFLQDFSKMEIPATATQPTPRPTATVGLVDDDEQDTPALDDGEGERSLPRLSSVVGDPEALRVLDEGDVVRHMTARFIERDGRTYVNERALTPEQRQAAQDIAAKNKQQIVRLAGMAEPVVSRFFREQRDRLVDLALRSDPLYNLPETREDGPVKAASDTTADFMSKRAVENIDWDEEDRLLREALRPWLESVSEIAFADIAAITGADTMWSISNPHLADLFDILGYRVTDINSTTRQAVEDIVRESLIDGTTIPDLADKLREAVEETYRGRASTIARTESQVAYSISSQKAYEASGVVSRVMMHDGVDCESGPGSDGLRCPDRQGMVVQVADMARHSQGTHPNCQLAFSPILDTPLGEV